MIEEQYRLKKKSCLTDSNYSEFTQWEHLPMGYILRNALPDISVTQTSKVAFP